MHLDSHSSKYILVHSYYINHIRNLFYINTNYFCIKIYKDHIIYHNIINYYSLHQLQNSMMHSLLFLLFHYWIRFFSFSKVRILKNRYDQVDIKIIISNRLNRMHPYNYYFQYILHPFLLFNIYHPFQLMLRIIDRMNYNGILVSNYLFFNHKILIIGFYYYNYCMYHYIQNMLIYYHHIKIFCFNNMVYIKVILHLNTPFVLMCYQNNHYNF